MGQITRFQVMGVLQAARARALGLTMDEAKSWGLNRALFYASAKHGWANAKALGAKRPILVEYEKSKEQQDPMVKLGGEKAFISPDLSGGLKFKYGDVIQTPLEFDRRIKRRFDDWESAWDEANRLIKATDPKNLRSSNRFFERVYKPVRDTLADKWSLPRAAASAVTPPKRRAA